MSGGGGSSQTVQQADPWKVQQPYLASLFKLGGEQFGRSFGDRYYPGTMVAPITPRTQQGLTEMFRRGAQGSPQQAAFGDYLTSTLGQPNVDPRQIAQIGRQAGQSLGMGQGYLGEAGRHTSYGQAARMAGIGQDIGFPGAAQYAAGITDPYTQALYGQAGQVNPYTGALAGQAFLGPQGYTQQLAQQAGGGVDPTAGGQLAQTAQGAYLTGNPYLDQVYQQAAEGVTERFQEDVMPAIAAQFGKAGRTGSGMHALATGRAGGELAESLRGLAGDIYAPAYEAERGRQLTAAGQLGQLGLGARGLDIDALGQAARTGLGERGLGVEALRGAGQLDVAGRGLDVEALGRAGQLGLGGGQLAADLYGTGLSGDIARRGMAADIYTGGLGRQVQAGQSLADIGLQGGGLLSDLYRNVGQQRAQAGAMVPAYSGLEYGDIDRMVQSGAFQQAQNQAVIDAAIQRHMANQQMPWQNLQNYANIVYGLPPGLGQTTVNQSGGRGNPLVGMAGGGLTGYALGGPWGAAIGGGAGLLGELF